MVNLGFDPTSKRFTKMVKGKRFVSVVGASKREAVGQYHQWYERLFGEDCREIARVQSAVDAVESSLASIGHSIESASGPVIRELLEASFANPAPPEDTLDDLVNAYFAHKLLSVPAQSLIPVRSHLRFYSDMVKNVEIKINDWEKFTKELKTRLNEKKWSSKYCASILVSVRAFLNWCNVTDRIDSIPKFVFSNEYKIKIVKKSVEVFTADELKTIFQNSSDELACIWQLCLNTAMTQKDVSELTWNMIDLEKGTLTRKRTKHEHQTSNRIPTVTYYLWDSILNFLKLKTKNSEFVFVRPDGKKLLNVRNDYLADEFSKIRGSMTKSIKHLRKTGNSIIQSSIEYRGWGDLYLANSPSGVNASHYDGTGIIPRQITDLIFEKLNLLNK